MRLVLFLLVLGFPLALGLAWIYNVTKEGIVREGTAGEAKRAGTGAKESADEAESVNEAESDPETSPRGSPLTSNVLVAGLLALAIGILLYPRIFSSGESVSGTRATSGQSTLADTAGAERQSIAVLPFEALSAGQRSKTFARGVHDDLLTRLANISNLTVISRTAVQQYRNTDLTTGEIADSLGVRWVMEGGMQVFGDQIQINAQLIDPRSEAHAWAEEYRRDLTAEDLFALQGEITREIADALKAKLTAGEQRRIAGAPTEDLKAYRLYIKGRSGLNMRTQEGMVNAVKYFRWAISQDSSFALAWSGLADARGLSFYGSDSLRALLPSQEKAARRALNLDPDLTEAHASLGFFYWQEKKVSKALSHLQRAVELKPNYAQGHQWLAIAQIVAGRLSRAQKHARRAVELDPRHFAARSTLIGAMLGEGDAQAAKTHPRKLREDQGSNLFFVGLTRAALGETAEAFATWEEKKDWGLLNTAVIRYLDPYVLSSLRDDPRYDELLRRLDRYWGQPENGDGPEESASAASRQGSAGPPTRFVGTG